jgi:hypothetical protein
VKYWRRLCTWIVASSGRVLLAIYTFARPIFKMDFIPCKTSSQRVHGALPSPHHGSTHGLVPDSPHGPYNKYRRSPRNLRRSPSARRLGEFSARLHVHIFDTKSLLTTQIKPPNSGCVINPRRGATVVGSPVLYPCTDILYAVLNTVHFGMSITSYRSDVQTATTSDV